MWGLRIFPWGMRDYICLRRRAPIAAKLMAKSFDSNSLKPSFRTKKTLSRFAAG